jgi:hypothetical protein
MKLKNNAEITLYAVQNQLIDSQAINPAKRRLPFERRRRTFTDKNLRRKTMSA